ncbi:hypothetical protein V1J52_10590 [Streptomyces sp. TRM 70351]|uniref:hypothetical protein n=1 Tax=Streptomyces sp. TRM 70351 TaxID=3116552 RepID=UPI002E7ABDCB|nr:hypothetical protein [Streptomyces sp. TRM 70351]MEE1928636.1 hypothetical protein [Streptomyces sp. TRM 70351]
MYEVLIGALALTTAVRVFVPDAARLARRGLAAGVRVGAASLGEPRYTAAPVHRRGGPALPPGEEERA